MSFLSRLLGRTSGPDSSTDSVTYDDVGVTRQHASGRVDDVDWADLREVAVMVRADGRGQPDPHVVLTGRKASTIVHSRVQGVGPLVTRLGKLPAFDQAAFDRATASTERGRVVCWQRPGAAQAAGAADDEAVPATAASPAHAARPVPAPVPAREALAALELELVPMAAEPAAAQPVAPARPSAGGAPRTDALPSRATVLACANEAIRDMARVYKIKLDGSLDSLAHLDSVIAEWHAAGVSPEAVGRPLYALGSYAGEVVRRQLRGRWLDAPAADAEGFVLVELEDGRRWSPISLCVDAVRSGARHSLLRSARELLAVQPPASGRL